ncbi:MAG: hypothetical protein APR63_11135 [Desulfuromonas sp. SDB]|nr:MAG: hypothetical protein APR63_11135 [Desulfuromonas sp. SDB]
MDIIWDKNKNDLLKLSRNISFEEISEKIVNKEYIDIIENPIREDQLYFIMSINNYIWILLFIIDEKLNIVLKTAFPSRKFNMKYGGRK